MKGFIFSLLIMMLPALALADAPSTSGDPQQVVQNGVNSLTQRLDKEKGHLKNNSKLLYSIIDENITPYIDIDGIARGVMGQYYRQANEQQKAAFVKVFKDSLIRTYANGLASYNNQKIVVKPYHPGSNPKIASVDVDVTGDNGAVYPVTFQMKQNAQGQWKTENLVLNGINLGLTFRNQFSAAIDQNNGNIDKAIAGWVPDTSSLEKKDK